MDIIRRGQPPSERKYQVVCTVCMSLLQYKHSEILSVSSDQRDGDSHALGNCPVCSAKLYNYAPKVLVTRDSYTER